MEMVEVRTADLTGPALRWSVAIAESADPVTFLSIHGSGGYLIMAKHSSQGAKLNYLPDRDWRLSGDLVEKYSIEFEWISDATIRAEIPGCGSYGYGNKHLTAACRAIVAAKLGAIVSVPKELMQ